MNTEELAKAAMHSKDGEYRLDGSGLHHFEAKIDFQRNACKFFKHDWVWFSNFNAMEWSFQNYLQDQDQQYLPAAGAQ